MHRFIALDFIKLWKVCGNLALSKFTGTIFPTAFARFMSLGHTLVVLAICQTFSLPSYCHGDLWSAIFDVITLTQWRLRWLLTSFRSIFNCTLRLHYYALGNKQTKKIRWLTLLQYLLYCDGLELNPNYFWGMTVYKFWIY